MNGQPSEKHRVVLWVISAVVLAALAVAIWQSGSKSTLSVRPPTGPVSVGQQFTVDVFFGGGGL